MHAHLVACVRLHSSIQILRKVQKHIAACGGASPAFAVRTPGLHFGGLRIGGLRGRNIQNPAQLLAHAQPRAMQPDPDGSLAQIENLRDLLGRQFLHVVKDEHHAQRRRNPENCLLHLVVLFGMEKIILGTPTRILQQPPKFRIVGHQFIEREEVAGFMSTFPAHPPATISGHGIQPNSQRLWFGNLRQVPDRTVKNLLHRVFGILGMAAHFSC